MAGNACMHGWVEQAITIVDDDPHLPYTMGPSGVGKEIKGEEEIATDS